MNNSNVYSIDILCKILKIRVNGQDYSVNEILLKDPTNHENLISLIHTVITQLNDGIDFGQDLSEEWVKYLLLLVNGHGENLKNPYGDICRYHLQPITDVSKNLDELNSIRIIDSLPDEPLKPTTPENLDTLKKTLLIIAVGGTDTTFYKGLSSEEIKAFASRLYGEELISNFRENNVTEFIPRGFAAKYSDKNVAISNVESTILHAYHAGIRNVAIIGNSKSYTPIFKYLQQKLKGLLDLNIAVVPQPLLPIIQANKNTGKAIISAENGGYPGGHGHGFKYCLNHPTVKKNIHNEGLKYFIFGNGDNAVILNWGANHFSWVINQLNTILNNKETDQFRIAFFLVWEFFRKGGFNFLLTDKTTNEQFTQIVETELAEESGADTKNLVENRGGYNTNVATGIIEKVECQFNKLPMALKQKNYGYVFEASLGTAISTNQDSLGRSRLDKSAVMSILGPKEALYQHWSHISIRKREDLFAYQSSLFKIGEVKTDFGDFPVIQTKRNGTQPHPLLKGDIVNPEIISTKDFYDIFNDSYFDVDQFTGVLNIKMMTAPGKIRGKIKFSGYIRLIGSGELVLNVKAGELWIIKDIEHVVSNFVELSRNDCNVIKL